MGQGIWRFVFPKLWLLGKIGKGRGDHGDGIAFSKEEMVLEKVLAGRLAMEKVLKCWLIQGWRVLKILRYFQRIVRTLMRSRRSQKLLRNKQVVGISPYWVSGVPS